MKDLVIPGSRFVRECWIALGCLPVAVGVNAFAIAKYGTRWIELLTAWPQTLAVALFLYLATVALRLGIFGAREIVTRLSSKSNPPPPSQQD